MEITSDYLKGEKESLMRQRENALAVAQQASGAIQLIDALLSKLEGGDSMTLDEFGKALGAKSVELVENEKE